jgi:hypothetical protein
VYSELLEHIKEKITEVYPLTYIGEQDWTKVLHINKEIVEILPGDGDRKDLGMGGVVDEAFYVDISVAVKGLAIDAENLEKHNAVSLEKIQELFRRYSTTICGTGISTTIPKYRLRRVLLAKKDGEGFYVTGCTITIRIKMTRR